MMYEGGTGISQDYVTAHMWYSLAKAQGIESMHEECGNIAEKMAPAQIAEGRHV